MPSAPIDLSQVPHCRNFAGLVDILLKVGEAYEEIPSKKHWLRPFLGPVFKASGVFIGWFLSRLPERASYHVHHFAWKKLAGPAFCPFSGNSENLLAAERLHGDLKRADGREPAILCLTSHPAVTGLDYHLNFELLRHASLAVCRIRGRAMSPRVIAALDPFALQEQPWILEDLYTGFMGVYHMGLNRMSVRGGTSYGTAGHRVIHFLKRRGELIMMVGGGVAETGRLLYSTREFLWKMHRLSHASLKETLRLDDKGVNAWRSLEGWIFAMLTRTAQPEPGEEAPKRHSQLGVIPPDVEESLVTLSRELNVSEKVFHRALSRYKEEFARHTPYRERLFYNLMHRIVNRGTPLMLLTFAHKPYPDPSVEMTDPIGLIPGEKGSARFWTYKGGKREEFSRLIDDFSRQFISERFP